MSVRVAMDPLAMEPRVSVSMSMEIRHDAPPAVLVIGSPGTGKSVLAKHLEATSNGKAVFVSVGEILRERGLLSNFDGGDLKATAVEIVRSAAGRALASGQVLLLECVKDVEDAFSLMEILHTTGLPLSQVLLIPRHGIVAPVLLPELGKPVAVHDESMRRDAERNPFDRQPKWNANVSRLIDFFSSLGVLHEVFPTPLIRLVKWHDFSQSSTSFQRYLQQYFDRATSSLTSLAPTSSLAPLSFLDVAVSLRTKFVRVRNQQVLSYW